MQLRDLKIGQTVRVVKLSGGDKLYRQKLVAMGVTPGTLIRLAGIAPLGDPLEIAVRSSMLCLRKDEANIILIEEA